MKATITKWGNSLALRIPKVLAEELGLSQNSTVDLKVTQDTLVVEKQRSKEQTLVHLLDTLKPEQIHHLEDWGEDTTREAKSWQ